jgi:hypothetical protein
MGEELERAVAELTRVKRLLEASLETTDHQQEQLAQEAQHSRRLEGDLKAANEALVELKDNGGDASEWTALVQVTVLPSCLSERSIHDKYLNRKTKTTARRQRSFARTWPFWLVTFKSLQ